MYQCTYVRSISIFIYRYYYYYYYYYYYWGGGQILCSNLTLHVMNRYKILPFEKLVPNPFTYEESVLNSQTFEKSRQNHHICEEFVSNHHTYEQVAQRATIAQLRTSKYFLNSSLVSKRFFQLVKGSQLCSQWLTKF